VSVSKLVILDYSLVALALVLLASEWLMTLARRRRAISLVVITVSFIWLLIALVWPPAIGPSYSNVHGYIILANLTATALAAVAALALRSQRSWRSCLAAVSLTCVWVFALGVMYAV
jgi:hypothetical protein